MNSKSSMLCLFKLSEEWHWVSLILLVAPLILFLIAYLLLLCRNYIYSYEEIRADFPPGSRGMIPFLGETLQFLAAMHSKQGFYHFVQLRHRWYGSCFKTHIFGETHVFVSNTEAAKVILSNDLGRFTKRYLRSIREVVGEESLLCACYQSHKLIRGRLLDLFSSTSISEFTTEFDKLVVDTIAGWEHKGRVVILDEALEITFKAMCKMLLSLEDECELDLLQKDVACVCQAMLAFPLKFPWSRFSKGIQARKGIMSTLEKKIKERKGGDSYVEHKDFLQYLLQARDSRRFSSDQAPTLTDEQIKDNILTMIIAGQDTTASAITWMIKYLDENPIVLEAVMDEIKCLEKKAMENSLVTLEELNEMTYATKVVKESLRMASVVPWFPRVALHDCKIQGYTIKKGWNINVDARSIHFDPTLFANPQMFNPSRFDEDPKPYSFLAFGAGARTCLGMNLAKAMMLVFLRRLVTTYKWTVTNPDSSVEKWALFSRLKSGCPIQITRV